MGTCHAYDVVSIDWVVNDVPWAAELLLFWVRGTTSQVVTPLTPDSRDVFRRLGPQVCFPDKVVLDITQQKTVVPIIVDEVTHALSMIELSFTEGALLVPNLTSAYLLQESIGCRIKNQVAIV